MSNPAAAEGPVAPASAPESTSGPVHVPGGSPATDRPHVTVVIPARDCAVHLPECLSAISAQTYVGPLDVVIAVAPSNDDTEQAVADACRDQQLRMPLQAVGNPAGTTSSGLNRALEAAVGQVIVRVDAQARLPSTYIERAVATLARTGAANVGGVQRPVGRPGLSSVTAAAMASPFGGGPAAFRRGSRPGPTDTVYLGVFDAAALAAVGGFDETLERNQDYELNWRLREQGRLVWLDPELVVDYLPRSSWPALARQYFDYGIAKRCVICRHPRSTRLRQLAAPALVLGLVWSTLALLRGRARGAVVPVAYLTACAAAASRLKERLRSAPDRRRAAAAFAVMHLAWGLGFLAGPSGQCPKPRVGCAAASTSSPGASSGQSSLACRLRSTLLLRSLCRDRR